MARFTLVPPVRWQVCAIGLAIALSAIINAGHAGSLPSYSDVISSKFGQPPTGLITLPGQNGAQGAMSGSINNVCPTISNIAIGKDPPTQGQMDLATICQA